MGSYVKDVEVGGGTEEIHVQERNGIGEMNVEEKRDTEDKSVERRIEEFYIQ